MKKPFRADWNESLDVAIETVKLFRSIASAHQNSIPDTAVKGDTLLAMHTTETALLRGVVCNLAKELFDRMDDMQSSLDSLNHH